MNAGAIRESNGVYLLPEPHRGALTDLATEISRSPFIRQIRNLEAQVAAAVAEVEGNPTLEEVKANPGLLDRYSAQVLSTQEIRHRGLGDYHRHVDVLSDIFRKLDEQQVHGVGRWSFSSQCGTSTTYVMPAEVSGLKGIKVIQSHPENLEVGLPRSNATILLFDSQTGILTAAVAGSVVTPVKTAAQSAIVLKLWNEQNGNPPVNLGILGGGPVAREHFSAFKMLLGANLQTSCFHSPRQTGRELVQTLLSTSQGNAAIVFEENSDAAQWRSNVIIAATTSKTVTIDERRITESKQPTLLFAIGPNDISFSALQHADVVVVDDSIGYRDQKNAVADYLRSSPTNVLSLCSLVRNSEILRGARSVVFAPMGVGLSDVALCVDLLMKPLGRGGTRPSSQRLPTF